MKVSKIFYGICRSNYIWGPLLFSPTAHPSEIMMKIIYQNNQSYFSNYIGFKNYVIIDYQLDGNTIGYNYFDLFKNIMILASDLRVPYGHMEIIPKIKLWFKEVIKNGINYDDAFYYIVKAVDDLSRYYNRKYFWKYEISNSNCQLLFIMKQNKSNKMILQKIIRPFNVPAKVIKKTKIIFFPETINRVFGLYD